MEDLQQAEVLIIGGGPGGIQCTNTIKHYSPDTKVVVLRPETHSMVYCAIPYAIEGLFPIDRTFKKDELITGVGGILVRQKAVQADLKNKVVTIEDGSQIRFDKLLIATGARPFVPPVPGNELGRIFTVKTEDDTRAIIKAVEEGKHKSKTSTPKAVVVGAGAIGIEQALAYRAHGFETHLVEMMPYPLPQLLDEDMAEPIIEELRDAGVILHLGISLKALKGKEFVAGVELSDGSTIELEEGRDFVVFGIGMRPDIDLFKDTGIEIEKDGIVVDEHMRTSLPGVWAVGDCVHFKSGIDGKPIGGKLATNAVPMAKVAARDMLGLPARYRGYFNGAATVVGKLRVGGTGFSERIARARNFDVFVTYGETTARFPMMPDAGIVRIKLIFEKGTKRLLGGQVLATEAVAERVDLLTLSIQHGFSAQDLAELSYSAQPWQSHLPARNAIVEAATKAVDLEFYTDQPEPTEPGMS